MHAAAARLMAPLAPLFVLVALLGGALWAVPAAPAPSPSPALARTGRAAAQAEAPLVRQVAMVGFTVADLARSVAFFTRVLDFELLDQFELNDRELDVLHGVFGANARIAHLRLGEQVVELTQYRTSQGRPIPVPSHSHDLWFQHVAIVVSDLDAAVARLVAADAAQISTEPITIPADNVAAAGIRAFKFRDPDGHALRLVER